MLTQTKSYRYQLPKKAVKTDCSQCGNRYTKTFSRYVDTQNGELLPAEYGRCDRESNCGHFLSPYHKQASGLSYADEQKQPTIPKEWFRIAYKGKRQQITKASISQTLLTMFSATPEQAEQVIKKVFSEASLFSPFTPKPIYSIPDDVYKQSLSHYDRNQFARLLCRQFGQSVATDLLQRFQIGTSNRWPGACVFWYIDEKGRKRGGQIKLFNTDWHTVKYVDCNGEKRSRTSWVHSALIRRYKATETPVPDWLTEYDEKADRSPCLFGLPQLLTAPIDKPVAIVEAPKTAIICTPHFPGFIWLAVGSLSYLTTNTDAGLARLAPLRGRKVMLFPDLNGFAKWSKTAEQLREKGFQVEVSDYLEQVATDEQKAAGLDLADFILMPTQSPRIVTRLTDWKRGTILRPDESELERLSVERCDGYPSAWDDPPAPDAVPRLRVQSATDWLTSTIKNHF